MRLLEITTLLFNWFLPISRYAKAAGIGAASLALALSANAANVKLGGDDGALVFVPAEIEIAVGDSVTWTNNRGFPHNVVFDEDEVPVRSLRSQDGASTYQGGPSADSWSILLEKMRHGNSIYKNSRGMFYN
jgi:plastocyanin